MTGGPRLRRRTMQLRALLGLACAIAASGCVARTATTFHAAQPAVSGQSAPAAPVLTAAVATEVTDVNLLLSHGARFLGTADIDDDSRPTLALAYVINSLPANTAKLGATHFTTIAKWTERGWGRTVELLWAVPAEQWPDLPARLRPAAPAASGANVARRP